MLNSLEKKISEDTKAAIIDTLKNEVAEVATDVVIQRNKTDVYDVYSPHRYVRRNDNGGMLDRANVVSKVDGKSMTLEVKNVTKFNLGRDGQGPYVAKLQGKTLTEHIVDGWSSVKPGDPAYKHPRPFMENAGESLEGDGANRKDLERAFEAGLGRQGIYKTKG